MLGGVEAVGLTRRAKGKRAPCDLIDEAGFYDCKRARRRLPAVWREAQPLTTPLRRRRRRDSTAPPPPPCPHRPSPTPPAPGRRRRADGRPSVAEPGRERALVPVEVERPDGREVAADLDDHPELRSGRAWGGAVSVLSASRERRGRKDSRRSSRSTPQQPRPSPRSTPGTQAYRSRGSGQR